MQDKIDSACKEVNKESALTSVVTNRIEELETSNRDNIHALGDVRRKCQSIQAKLDNLSRASLPRDDPIVRDDPNLVTKPAFRSHEGSVNSRFSVMNKWVTDLETSLVKLESKTIDHSPDRGLCCSICAEKHEQVDALRLDLCVLIQLLMQLGIAPEESKDSFNIMVNCSQTQEMQTRLEALKVTSKVAPNPFGSTPKGPGTLGVSYLGCSPIKDLQPTNRTTDMQSPVPVRELDDLKVNETIKSLSSSDESSRAGGKSFTIKDQLNNIRVNDGKERDTFRPWIKSVEKAARLCNINPHEIAVAKSSGALEHFISRKMKEGEVKWGTLKREMSECFSDLRTTEDVITGIKKCKQGKNTLASYINEFEELCVGLGGKETSLLINDFIDGLSDGLLKTKLKTLWRTDAIDSLESVITQATNFDRVYSGLGNDDFLVSSSKAAAKEAHDNLATQLVETTRMLAALSGMENGESNNELDANWSSPNTRENFPVRPSQFNNGPGDGNYHPPERQNFQGGNQGYGPNQYGPRGGNQGQWQSGPPPWRNSWSNGWGNYPYPGNSNNRGGYVNRGGFSRGNFSRRVTFNRNFQGDPNRGNNPHNNNNANKGDKTEQSSTKKTQPGYEHKVENKYKENANCIGPADYQVRKKVR